MAERGPKRSTLQCRYAKIRRAILNSPSSRSRQPSGLDIHHFAHSLRKLRKERSMELKLETVVTIIHQFKTLGNQGRQNALFDFIHELPDQQKMELTAIFWVGRD